MHPTSAFLVPHPFTVLRVLKTALMSTILNLPYAWWQCPSLAQRSTRFEPSFVCKHKIHRRRRLVIAFSDTPHCTTSKQWSKLQMNPEEQLSLFADGTSHTTFCKHEIYRIRQLVDAFSKIQHWRWIRKLLLLNPEAPGAGDSFFTSKKQPQ